MMKLEEYPEAIEQAKKHVDEGWQQFFDYQEEEEQLERQYKKEAAENPNLTNSTKRKAHVAQRKQSEAYQKIRQKRIDAKTEVNHRQFALERLQDEYDAVKIRELTDTFAGLALGMFHVSGVDLSELDWRPDHIPNLK